MKKLVLHLHEIRKPWTIVNNPARSGEFTDLVAVNGQAVPFFVDENDGDCIVFGPVKMTDGIAFYTWDEKIRMFRRLMSMSLCPGGDTR